MVFIDFREGVGKKREGGRVGGRVRIWQGGGKNGRMNVHSSKFQVMLVLLV